MISGKTSITTSPDCAISEVALGLSAALEKGNSSAAAELFTADAVLEDYTLRARSDGRLALGRYLDRAVESLPWGVNATVRHVVGSKGGGGYEWIGGERAAARNGIIAIDLNGEGIITWSTVVWDASRTSIATTEKLVGFSTE